MSLSQNEFNVLYALHRAEAPLTQRQLAAQSGLGVATVNKTLRALADRGLVANRVITPAGEDALAPYKVDNAVIMAAGLASRFAPLSYELPKGLLRVRGEVLIERQIRQLQEAGITDITVVVGYKKERFFYLEDKLGVKIRVNNEYASRNNNSSLWVVRHELGNTFVCSSDDYFDVNPFEDHVWKAYYAAQFAAGETEEWCITTGPHHRITGVEVGGADAWYMLGQVYFDREFSKTFVRILEQEYHKPETAPKLWESIYLGHLDELDMRMRPYDPPIVHEFDSLDELRDFDPLFLENVDSKVFDNICSVLGCQKTEIHDVYPLKESLTNLSCHFATDSGEYVYRHPGVGTENIINRPSEKAALEAARDAGLDHTYIFANADEGWKISRFVPNATTLDVHQPDQMAQAMEVARQLHASGMQLPGRFSYWGDFKHYEEVLLSRGSIDVPDYWEWAEKARRVHELMANDDAPTCSTHNDFFYLNFLIEQDGTFNLIDWEYAGMGDYANDLATFAVTSELSPEEVDQAIDLYFEGHATPEEYRHNIAMIGLCGWCWYVWGLLKESDGDFIGEWLYIYYRYAKRYLDRALELYQGENAS